MPKKLNFLGGQQNYDENNGQYLPNLVGGDGEIYTGGKKEATNLKKGVDDLDIINAGNEKEIKLKEEPTSLKEGVDQLEKDSKKGFSNFGNQTDQEKAKETHTKELTDYIKQMIETHDYEGSIEDIAEKIYYDSPYSIHSHDEMYEIAYNMLSEKQQNKSQPKTEEPKEKTLNDYTDQLFKEANVTTYTSKKGKNPKGEIIEIRRFGDGENAIRYNETLNKVEQVWINGKRVA